VRLAGVGLADQQHPAEVGERLLVRFQERLLRRIK